MKGDEPPAWMNETQFFWLPQQQQVSRVGGLPGGHHTACNVWLKLQLVYRRCSVKVPTSSTCQGMQQGFLFVVSTRIDSGVTHSAAMIVAAAASPSGGGVLESFIR